MPQIIEEIRPGDLITAEYLNSLAVCIRDLETRVATIEGQDGAVIILGVLPNAPMRIGDAIEIIGHNFGFTSGAHRVYFNSTRATNFSPDSGDNRLITTIPTIPGVSEVGSQVVLTVGNQFTSDTSEITVRPTITNQQGNIIMTYQGTEPTTINAGDALTLQYTLESNALLPASVLISPNVAGLPQPLNIELVNATGNVMPARMIGLEPGAEVDFGVRIDPIPTGSDGMPFTVSVQATATGLTASDGPRPFEVGSTVEPQDTTVTSFGFNTAQPGTAVTGTTIQLSPGNTVAVQLMAEFEGPTPAGVSRTYTFSVRIDPPTASWEATTPSSNIVFAGGTTFTVTTPGQSEFMAFDVTAAGVDDATLICQLQRVEGGQTFNRTLPFNLQAV